MTVLNNGTNNAINGNTEARGGVTEKKIIYTEFGATWLKIQDQGTHRLEGVMDQHSADYKCYLKKTLITSQMRQNSAG